MMCMTPLSKDPEDSRPVFIRCYELFDEMQLSKNSGDAFNILSMGMSNDFEVAIECGANVVRVGTALFGENGEAKKADSTTTASL